MERKESGAFDEDSLLLSWVDSSLYDSFVFSGKEVGRSKEDEIMRKGKVKGQSQTILGFVESGYEKVTTERMCGIFSTKGEKAEPHDMVGFIDTGIDQSGECIKFSLSGIHPKKRR